MAGKKGVDAILMALIVSGTRVVVTCLTGAVRQFGK